MNPMSSFQRPADTNAYAQNDLIANSVTAGSVVLPSIMLPIGSQGSIAIPRMRFFTNIAAGWQGVVLRARLWFGQPTYANGDNGAYSIATGAALRANYSGFDFTLTQLADGAIGDAAPNVGNAVFLSATSLFWDLQLLSAAATPISGQIFQLTPEILV